MGHDLLQNELSVATTLLNKKGYIAKPFRKQRGCIMEACIKTESLDSGSALQNRIGWGGGDRGVERPRAAPRILMLF